LVHQKLSKLPLLSAIRTLTFYRHGGTELFLATNLPASKLALQAGTQKHKIARNIFCAFWCFGALVAISVFFRKHMRH